MIEFALQKKLHTTDGEMQLHVECRLEAGQFISLYGPSGAGKTSVLRMLAGFMKPDDGFIRLGETTWYEASRHIHVDPQRRKIGFVFQDYALFPNMNVQENIAFASPKDTPPDFVAELLSFTGLTMLASRKVQTLSGGQKQRVALARAIATKPSFLLLDEPLSAIDNALRAQLQSTLLEVHRRFELTTVLVSHDMDEIIKLSDKVIHLQHGRIQQIASPTEFFLNGNKTAHLTGEIVSVDEEGGTVYNVVLLNNRMIRIETGDGGGKYHVGEKVEIVYKNDAVEIRKF